MAATGVPMGSGSRGLLLKKNFLFLCIISLCLVFVYIGLQLYVTNIYHIAKVKSLFQIQLTQPRSTVTGNDGIYRRFLEIQRDYKKKLSSIPIISYKPSESFIDYGEPVRNYLPANSSEVKRILAWNSFFGDMNYIPLKFECGNNISCETTYNRKDLLTSDAILMHARELGGLRGLPDKRLPHQRWVHFVMESPYHLGLRPADFNGVFNYTLTYRYDSDAQVQYFSLFKREIPLSNDQYKTLFIEIMASKTKLVSQMHSNCGATHTKRLSFVGELQRHLHVDTYGKCGNLTCPHFTKECENTMSSYKFYLSTENSHCRDYITEKSGHPLFNWTAVPIVMGGAHPNDYERVLPQGSYINTAGFNTTKELAEYLVLLDKNPALYSRYHEWRKSYTGGVYVYNEAWCNLCRKLNNDSLPVQTYRDFKGWYDQDTCHI